MAKATCSIDGCELTVHSRQRCQRHYNRDHYSGTLKTLTLADKFWANVVKAAPDECWLWTGNVHPDYGYGRYNGKMAHRLSYEMAVGPIPDGLEIDHQCRNRACVNPNHLRSATRKQNQENVAPQKNCKSGVRGVSWDKARELWVVYVTHNHKNRNYGGYATLDEAEQVAIATRNRLFTYNVLDRGESVA